MQLFSKTKYIKIIVLLPHHQYYDQLLPYKFSQSVNNQEDRQF